MGLKGYTRRAGKCKGGIVRIAIVDADAVSKVKFDTVTGDAIDLELSEGESFALYNFKEDTAKLIEQTEIVGGFTHVRRELSFTLERPDESLKRSVSELLKKSPRGFVTIVLNGCGISYLIGYSRKFGSRFPMQVKLSQSSTGNSPEDISAETITLHNLDSEKAPVFRGEFPECTP